MGTAGTGRPVRSVGLGDGGAGGCPREAGTLWLWQVDRDPLSQTHGAGVRVEASALVFLEGHLERGLCSPRGQWEGGS